MVFAIVDNTAEPLFQENRNEHQDLHSSAQHGYSRGKRNETEDFALKVAGRADIFSVLVAVIVCLNIPSPFFESPVPTLH